MRNVLKGFLAFSILLSAFLCGFNYDLLHAFAQHGNRQALAYGAQTLPPRLLARLIAPAFAHADDSSPINPPDAYRIALNSIRRDYYGSALDNTKLTYAAIDGMLGTIGDPYTVFWTPDEYKSNMETNSGDFVGIGARLDLTRDKRVVVIEPIEDSPASHAGVLAGDIIVSINGKSTLGMSIDSVIDLIHGPEGSIIRLNVLRSGKAKQFTMTRAVVHTRIVDFRMADPVHKIGYIELGMFNEQADIQFDAALQKLEKQGLRGLIFDLRGNPGGLLQVAQDLASRFIDSGPIVWVREKNGHMSSLNVENDKHRSPLYKGAYPVVVLVNGDSASASEIVSGAIQDSGVGILLGTRTYGKGLVQTIMPLADDSAVKITTQHYFTRDQHDINIKRDLDGRAMSTVGGIQPNIELDFTDKQLAAQRAAIAADPRNDALADKYDPQIQRAIQVLDTKIK